MGRCDVCGNDYEKTMVITTAERRGAVDSFECALHARAPLCAEGAGVPERRVNA